MSPLFGHGPQQGIACCRKLRHTIGHQRIGNPGQIKPQPICLGQLRLCHTKIRRQCRGDMAMIAKGIHSCGRHGVDGVGADQALHIQHIAIGGVLGAGGGP